MKPSLARRCLFLAAIILLSQPLHLRALTINNYQVGVGSGPLCFPPCYQYYPSPLTMTPDDEVTFNGNGTPGSPNYEVDITDSDGNCINQFSISSYPAGANLVTFRTPGTYYIHDPSFSSCSGTCQGGPGCTGMVMAIFSHYPYTPTWTVSPTISPTFTISKTFTSSPTSTPTPTFSVSPTVTLTLTISPTFSVSPTISPTFTVSPTYTPAAVGIQIYNFEGQLVRDLGAKTIPFYGGGIGLSDNPFFASGTSLEEITAGTAVFSWDGRDNEGHMVPSDQYDVRAVLGATVSVVILQVQDLQSQAVRSLSSGSFVFPEPAKGDTAFLGLVMPESGNATLTIFNNAGDAVARLQQHLDAGSEVWTFHVGQYAQGVYFYRVTVQGDSGASHSLPTGKFRVAR